MLDRKMVKGTRQPFTMRETLLKISQAPSKDTEWKITRDKGQCREWKELSRKEESSAAEFIV